MKLQKGDITINRDENIIKIDCYYTRKHTPDSFTFFILGQYIHTFVKDISFEKKETGVVRIGSTHFNVETVHTSPDAMMAVDIPLGYSFKEGTQEIAAVQTNGTIAVQMLPELSEQKKDVIHNPQVLDEFKLKSG